MIARLSFPVVSFFLDCGIHRAASYLNGGSSWSIHSLGSRNSNTLSATHRRTSVSLLPQEPTYRHHLLTKRIVSTTYTRRRSIMSSSVASSWSSPQGPCADDNNDTAKELSTSAISRCIIPLSEESHKGSSGRIGVLGGSAQYTGAPYYAAMASLRAGADLAFVFTAQEATLAIKSYSPELMVTACYKACDFDELVSSFHEEEGTGDVPLSSLPHELITSSPQAQKMVEQMAECVISAMDRMHVLVIGPGMGRCPMVMQGVARVIQAAMERNLPLILDADALYMLSLPEYRNMLSCLSSHALEQQQQEHSVNHKHSIILTPNVVEYQRLFREEDANTVGSWDSFDHVTVVRKGRSDVILQNNKELLACDEQGGLKRSGGIGDILAGTLGTLISWNRILKDRQVATEKDIPLACWTACCFVRRATKIAFTQHRRAMTAPDVLDALGLAVDEMTLVRGDE